MSCRASESALIRIEVCIILLRGLTLYSQKRSDSDIGRLGDFRRGWMEYGAHDYTITGFFGCSAQSGLHILFGEIFLKAATT